MRRRWQEKDVEAYKSRRAAGGQQTDGTETLNRPPAAARGGGSGASPRVRRPKAMNRTEVEYEQLYLRPEQMAGEVVDYKFHGICLVLGIDFRYYPDFFVLPAAGRPQVREVKGPYIREDAIKSFKAAVTQFGGFFDFYLCQKLDSGGWQITRYVGGEP